MGIDKLERVMWRLRKLNPDSNSISRQNLVRSIMVECGTSPQTYYNNKKALITLGWIKTKRLKWVMTNVDLNGDY